MAPEPLFAPGASRLRTIPAGSAFLSELARGLAEACGLAHDPAALADAVIYVPNRRSARALSLALFDAAGGRTILAPDIRALGDMDNGEPAPICEQVLLQDAPALPETLRLGVLAQLARHYATRAMGVDMPPASALAAARELSGLLEQAAMSEDADWSRLQEASFGDLAAHWERAQGFLRIVTDLWPQWLEENSASDPFRARVRAASAMARHWQARPPPGIVVIAGSTGATPPGRILMRAALGLQKGLVVLPGLDTGLSAARHAAIEAAPGHPQNALVRTLGALGLSPQDVAAWPGLSETGPRRARRRLVQEALAPADATADWRETLSGIAGEAGQDIAGFVSQALAGVSLIEAPNETAEAEAAALLMRETLGQEGRTAALVTPDSALARRVSALLARWGISCTPSAPEPLGRTRAGSLISLCARWAADPGDPVRLACILKHPFVRPHFDSDRLDLFFLRGPRRWGGLEELAASIELRHQLEPRPAFTPADQVQAAALVRTLEGHVRSAGADLSSGLTTTQEAARLLADLAGRISQTPFPWAGDDGAGASLLLQRLAELGPFLGDISGEAFADLVESEAAGLGVPSAARPHPRLSIWGPLEARLQSADRLILAGLNEDVWPRRPSPDMFLPPRLRPEIGLSDPEERMGLSAHDFAQLACAPEVVMLYSARREDGPAVASRWVWRLRTLAEAAFGAQTAHMLPGTSGPVMGWVEAVHRRGLGELPEGFSAEPRPVRRDPPDWPRRLSVTRVDRLQRDPYAVWAEDQLGLGQVDVLDAPLATHLTGTAIHAALEAFEKEGGSAGRAGLLGHLRSALARQGQSRADWLARYAIWSDIADWYLDWRGERDLVSAPWLEVRGALELSIAGAPFTLSATADRIERTRCGDLVIVDFKTGTPPSDKAIAAGLDQQMPLQAIIAMRGGFAGIPQGRVSALEYVAVRGHPSSRRVGDALPDTSLEDLIGAAGEGLVRLIGAYRSAQAVFVSAPRIQFVRHDYGYNQLARRAEWNQDMQDGEDQGD